MVVVIGTHFLPVPMTVQISNSSDSNKTTVGSDLNGLEHLVFMISQICLVFKLRTLIYIFQPTANIDHLTEHIQLQTEIGKCIGFES